MCSPSVQANAVSWLHQNADYYGNLSYFWRLSRVPGVSAAEESVCPLFVGNDISSVLGDCSYVHQVVPNCQCLCVVIFDFWPIVAHHFILQRCYAQYSMRSLFVGCLVLSARHSVLIQHCFQTNKLRVRTRPSKKQTLGMTDWLANLREARCSRPVKVCSKKAMPDEHCDSTHAL